jgi:hypothetical protein
MRFLMLCLLLNRCFFDWYRNLLRKNCAWKVIILNYDIFWMWINVLLEHLSFSTILRHLLLLCFFDNLFLLEQILNRLIRDNSLLMILSLDCNITLINIAFYLHCVIIHYLYRVLVFFLDFFNLLFVLVNYLLNQTLLNYWFIPRYFLVMLVFIIIRL